MSLWTKRSGSQLASLQERITTTVALPLADPNTPVKLIGGELPRGLRIVNGQLEGTPFEVPRNTVYRFVLRADDGTQKQDRTYNIEVQGPDAPEWVTPEGLLPIGNNDTYYILDSAPVDFQLLARDTDTTSGQTLKYYIGNKDGELPPGIELTEDGKLVGIVDPVLALDKRSGRGAYDENNYDRYPYDFTVKSAQGWDSFFYDVSRYDEQVPTRSPRKLNRYYQFAVTVSDGDTISKRAFQIYLVGDDFLRVDNTIMQVGTGVFTADNTHIRTPIWLTPRDLGVRRANNYITLFLDIIDPNSLVGSVAYQLVDGELPPGTNLDQTSGEIFGRVPYQPAVTKEYTFTIRANRFTSTTTEVASSDKEFTVRLIGEVESTITWQTAADLGDIPSNYISTLSVKAQTSVPNAILLYSLTDGKLPPGLRLSYDGEIIGKINSFGTVDDPGLTVFDTDTFTLDGESTSIDREFNFTIRAQDQFGFSATSRTFTIKVGDPDDKLYSNIFYKPLLKLEQRNIYKEFLSNPDIFKPEDIYRPNDPRFGLQQNIQMLVYSGIETVNVERYVAAAAKTARRKFLKIADLKTAVAKEPGTNNILYEVVYLEVTDPYDVKGQASNKIKIKNNKKILVNSVRTTPGDPNYDISNQSSLVCVTRNGGANNKYFDDYIECVTRDGTVRWYFGTDLYITSNSGNIIETAYVKGSSTNLNQRPVPENTITADSDAIVVSDPNSNVRYFSNITNIRDNLRLLGRTERNFLPLWMRTAQEDSIQELGYTLAIPICYCKPGTSETIAAAIRFSEFDYRQFELDVDRFLIDSTAGNGQEQYILFANYEFNI